MKRLLLDEMLSAAIAEQLEPYLDVRAVSSDVATRGLPDADVLALATAEERVLITDNIGDFVALSADWAAAGKTHAGLLFISSKTYPQDRARTGRIVAALRARSEARHWPAPGHYEFL